MIHKWLKSNNVLLEALVVLGSLCSLLLDIYRRFFKKECIVYTVFIEAGRQLRILVELSLAYLALSKVTNQALFSLKNSPRLEVRRS